MLMLTNILEKYFIFTFECLESSHIIIVKCNVNKCVEKN